MFVLVSVYNREIRTCFKAQRLTSATYALTRLLKGFASLHTQQPCKVSPPSAAWSSAVLSKDTSTYAASTLNHKRCTYWSTHSTTNMATVLNSTSYLWLHLSFLFSWCETDVCSDLLENRTDKVVFLILILTWKMLKTKFQTFQDHIGSLEMKPLTSSNFRTW